jgi:hypothetical protein
MLTFNIKQELEQYRDKDRGVFKSFYQDIKLNFNLEDDLAIFNETYAIYAKDIQIRRIVCRVIEANKIQVGTLECGTLKAKEVYAREIDAVNVECDILSVSTLSVKKDATIKNILDVNYKPKIGGKITYGKLSESSKKFFEKERF